MMMILFTINTEQQYCKTTQLIPQEQVDKMNEKMKKILSKK